MIFLRMAFIMVFWWSVTCPYLAAQAVERYILVLKDGRRIAVSDYAIEGDQIFYERFDARIGIARAAVETIRVVPESNDLPALEDVILGRVLETYNRSFTLGDFMREDYFTAEIEPRLTREEQTAYVRKLIRLKQREILEIEDQRLVAESKGDIVDLGALEQKLIAALMDLNTGQRALLRLAQRQHAGASRGDAAPDLSGAAAGTSVARPMKAEVPIDPLMEPSAGLARLQHRREMLVLMIKKNYAAGEKSGGVRALQQARQDLRIVDLQIRYFDQLAGMPTISPPPIP